MNAGWRHDAGIAYAVLRLTLGVDFMTHGAPRLFNMTTFVALTVSQFHGTSLPVWSVAAFATAIPWIEVVAGLLLVAGFQLRIGLPLLGLYMLVLVFGTTLRGRYDIVAEQLAYVLLIAILTAARSLDLYSLDKRIDSFATTLSAGSRSSQKPERPPSERSSIIKRFGADYRRFDNDFNK